MKDLSLKQSFALLRNAFYIRLLGVSMKISKWSADKAQESLDKAKELL